MRKLAIAAVLLCCGAIALLLVRRGPEAEPVAVSPAVDVRDGSSPQEVTSSRVEPAPARAPGSPEPRPAAIPGPSEAAPELGETASSLRAAPNSGLAFALFRTR